MKKFLALLALTLGLAFPADGQSGSKIVTNSTANGATGNMQTGPRPAGVTITFCGTGFSGDLYVDSGTTEAGIANVWSTTLVTNSNCSTVYTESPAKKWYKVRWTRSAGTLNAWMAIQQGDTIGGGVPTNCLSGNLVGLFFGSPVASGCDAGLTYNAATDVLTAGAVAAKNVTVSGLATPGSITVTPTGTTGATTYTYKLVARLADGTTTEAGANSTTAAGHATLSAINYNALSWAAVSGAASYDVYRTVGGATQGKIASATTALSLNDTGLAGGGETAPTVDNTGRITTDTLTSTGRVTAYAIEVTGIGQGVSLNGTGLGFRAAAGHSFSFSSSTTNGSAGQDTYLTRGGAAATFQLGLANSATPVAQTLQAQGATGTNISGADLTVSAGKGTGLANSTAAGRRGDLKLRTQVRGSTGSTADTVGTDRAVFAGQVVTLTESSATPVLDFAVASGSVAGGTLYYTIRADDATDFQVVRGSIPFTAVNKGGTLTATIGTAAESVAVSTGTLTNTVTITTGTNSITLNLNAVSSLTQTTLYAYVSALIDGTGVATTK